MTGEIVAAAEKIGETIAKAAEKTAEVAAECAKESAEIAEHAASSIEIHGKPFEIPIEKPNMEIVKNRSLESVMIENDELPFPQPEDAPIEFPIEEMPELPPRPIPIPDFPGEGEISILDFLDSDDEVVEAASEAEATEASEAEEKVGLSDEEKALIKDETGWSDEIIDNITNIKQYEILKNAGLIEVEINGRKCLVKKDLDLDTPIKDAYGREKTNMERIAEGSAPLDPKTGHPLELHHLGQSADSPLVELTREEHRTGEYEDGKKNQSLWHDNTKETEVHGEGNNWASERENHWSERVKQVDGGNGNE